jgi:hypothetical protein
MDGKVKSMAQKRARHYPETKTVVAISMIIFGICSSFVLIVLWPQQFLITIFNSRLASRLTIDNQDYYTCSKDYQNFVISEPDSSYNLISFYVFTVLNPQQVVQRGFEPQIEETGPYGFVKNTYKYDITFDPSDSLTVSYKEYSYLIEVTDDPDACEAMYYRMERDYLQPNACANNACKCKSSLNKVTIVNPLFLKIMWQDSPFDMLSYYSMESFRNIKTMLDEPFTEAVKATLVSTALKEVYQFRINMQGLKLVNSTISYLLSHNYTLYQIVDQPTVWTHCGLDQYGVNGCPFILNNVYGNIKSENNSIPLSLYPSLIPFFNSSLPILNLLNETNFARWIAISWYYGYLPFNSVNGFTTITKEEVYSLFFNEILDDYARVNYDVSSATLLTSLQRKVLIAGIRSIAKFLGSVYLLPTSFLVTSVCTSLTYKEFTSTSSPVICDPTGAKCIWQYGYMKEYHGSTLTTHNGEMTLPLIQSIIDLSTELSTNPNNFYKDLNAAPYYNAYLYCNNIFPYSKPNLKLQCTDLGYTFQDGITNKPAGLWGADNGISSVNFTNLLVNYRKVDESIKLNYFYLSCNLSQLVQDVYRTSTSFHDIYVIRYLNKYQDSSLNYTFTVGNWSDLGIAQWAGGFITDSIMSVRTIQQVKRNGMWRIGDRKYYEYFPEYSSWSILQGYPNAWLYSIEEARLLLNTLARNDNIGTAFRRHIMYTGSTFIGNGSKIIREVGEPGDVTFIAENYFASFECSKTPVSKVCDILDVRFTSSAADCAFIEDMYKECTREQLFHNNLCKL